MRLPRILGPVAAAALLLAACGVFEPAAAVVDGRRIEDEHFTRIVALVRADPRFVEAAVPEQAAQQRLELIRGILSFLIQQEFVERRAAERGITVAEEEVDSLLEGQIVQVGGEEAFREQLEESGASVEDIRDILRQQILRDRVARDLAGEEVPDEEMDELGRQDAFARWLREQFRTADIRVNPRYGVFDSDSGLVVPRTATTPLPPGS